MKLSKALTFLENVTNKTMAVPMRRYAGSTGRTAQGESPFFFYILKKIPDESEEWIVWKDEQHRQIYDSHWDMQ